MDDTISRQAAIDVVMQYCPDDDGSCSKADRDIRELLDDIENLPSHSHSTEIIRCKDCKHRHLDGMIWNCPFGLSGGEDFFCAYGAKDGDSDDE